jgi:molybdopterin-guanine dinucleotide biosynthesis protein A
VTLNKRSLHFHELEIAGATGCGKTTLIKNIILHLEGITRIFKDSDYPHIPVLEKKLLALDFDFALIERSSENTGNAGIQKIMFLEEGTIDNTANVIAYITTSDQKDFHQGKPCFNRDNIEAIGNFMVTTFQNEIKAWPLNAIVLVGGKSLRMGHDKGKIDYHGESQAQYLANILTRFCENVFFSCRQDQSNESHLQNYPHIYDQFQEMGPVGGILSYFKTYPLTRLLVVACDMPFIDSSSIEKLINQQGHFKIATSFINGEKNWPEPLFTIYHPKSAARFYQFLALGYNCPMKMLLNSDIKKIFLESNRPLLNGNTALEMDQLKQSLKESEK